MSDIIATLMSVDGGKFIAILGIIMWIDIRGSVKDMASSVKILTIQMAKIVERVDSHEKRIDRLEEK